MRGLPLPDARSFTSPLTPYDAWDSTTTPVVALQLRRRGVTDPHPGVMLGACPHPCDNATPARPYLALQIHVGQPTTEP
jgi:hypothetical protein